MSEQRRSLPRLVVFAISALVVFAAPAASAQSGQPWRDPTRPPLERASLLLAALSFDQKVDFALGKFTDFASFGVPNLSSDDGPNGVRAPGTTAFPSAQNLAATFDTELARAYGAAVGAELRGKGFNAWLAPAQDIARTPLAGRQPENLGEDPFLAGHTVASEVAGVKSQHVISTLKHYVGNNQDFQRIGFQIGPVAFVRGAPVNDLVSERALREIYEAPFQIGVQQGGADAVMCSYNRVNGLQTCESPSLLDTLKQDDRFQGYVIPDFGFAVRDVLAATNAGVDVPALGGSGGRTAAMFTSGQVSAERLDDIVRRTLFAFFDSGAFDNPLPAPADVVSTPEHRALAARISEAGMVLLKNQRDALPLSERTPRSLAVIGPSGTDAMFVNGGSASVPVDPSRAVTPLDGITARAHGISLHVVQGSSGDVPLTTLVPASVLTPSSGSGQGLLATYFNTPDFSGTAVLTQVEPGVDHAAAPAGVGPLWSARWTGTLTPPESGLYRVSVLSAGLVQLSIDDRQVASGYREATQFLGGPFYPIQGAVQLEAGRPVSIKLEYTSKAQLFGAQIHLDWQPPSASDIGAAVEAARHADAAIVFANGAQGEGMDRSTLALAGDQDQLIEAVAAVNRRTIVVLNTGGPVLMPWLRDVDAVVEAWYPGEQFGTALAAVLFGDAEPGGRLPVTFPASDAQGPAPATQPAHYPGIDGDEHYDEGIFVGYRWYDRFHQEPLFPFGFGLSYADFHFHDLRVDADGAVIQASVQVSNVSRRAGAAVAELYLDSPRWTGEPLQLKGYARVPLAPGESRHVSFQLSRQDLAHFDEAAHQWVVDDGRYTLEVGSSSRDLDTRDSFEIDSHHPR